MFNGCYVNGCNCAWVVKAASISQTFDRFQHQWSMRYIVSYCQHNISCDFFCKYHLRCLDVEMYQVDILKLNECRFVVVL